MSFIEIQNWNRSGPKTFLVLNFQAATKVEDVPGFFSEPKLSPDPEKTVVTVQETSTVPTDLTLAVGYEAFKATIVESTKTGNVPTFKI